MNLDTAVWYTSKITGRLVEWGNLFTREAAEILVKRLQDNGYQAWTVDETQ